MFGSLFVVSVPSSAAPHQTSVYAGAGQASERLVGTGVGDNFSCETVRNVSTPAEKISVHCSSPSKVTPVPSEGSFLTGRAWAVSTAIHRRPLHVLHELRSSESESAHVVGVGVVVGDAVAEGVRCVG
jgi:hypothetical protein